MKEKYLPIGSVVILKGGTKKVMITGYCVESKEYKNKIFDYRGCPFPEGVIISEGVALFDHSQIDKIIHLGYQSKEVNEFLNTLKDITEEKNV